MNENKEEIREFIRKNYEGVALKGSGAKNISLYLHHQNSGKILSLLC